MARTIYVGPDGSDVADGATPATALKTAQLAHDRAEAGDTILLLEGTYTVESGQGLIVVSKSGEAGKPITIAAAEGRRVLIRNTGAWNAIRIQGASHIVVRGLEIEGIGGTISLEEAQREMSNLGNPRTSGNGIGIVSGPHSKAPSSHITVSDCIVRDMPGGGIYVMHSDYVTIERNVVYRCAFTSPYANSGISIYQPVDVDENATDYKLIVRDNVCFENYNHVPFYYSNVDDPAARKVTDGNGIILDDYFNTQAFGGARPKAYGGKTLVANNVSFSNGGSGIHVFLSNNVDIVHNYAAGNNRHPQIKDGQVFANSSANVRVLNNVLVAPAGKPVNSDYRNREGVVYDHNVYASGDGATPKYARDLASNRLADPGLTLTGWERGGRTVNAKADSPLRGTGVSFPAAGDDFFGKTRGERPDIGPFVLGD